MSKGKTAEEIKHAENKFNEWIKTLSDNRKLIARIIEENYNPDCYFMNPHSELIYFVNAIEQYAEQKLKEREGKNAKLLKRIEELEEVLKNLIEACEHIME